MAQQRVSRSGLDVLARAAGLDAQGSAQLLDDARALPSAAEWRQTLQRFAGIAGVLALGFGAVFFIAANWSALTPGGRLWLLQGLFLIAIAAALWRPPPQVLGRSALLFAFIGAGALFALFGQTFQTGADVYELFVLWTLLGLPLVFAARWSPVTAAWLLVGNVALALFCGVVPAQHPLWMLLGFDERSWALRMLIAMLPNLLLWGVAEWRAMRDPALELLLPRWLRRLLLLAGLGYGTLAAFVAILDSHRQAAMVLPLFLVSAVAVAAFCLRFRREALGPVALAASAVVLGLAVLMEIIPSGAQELSLLLLPLWVVVASGAAGVVLVPLVRRWEGDSHEA